MNSMDEQKRLFEAETGQRGHVPPPPAFARPSFTPSTVKSGLPSLTKNNLSPYKKEYAAPPAISKPAEPEEEDIFGTLLKYEKEVRAEKKEKKAQEKLKKAGLIKEISPTPSQMVKQPPLMVPANAIRSAPPQPAPGHTAKTTTITKTTISAEPVRSGPPSGASKGIGGTDVTPEEIMAKARQMAELVRHSQLIESKRLGVPATKQVGSMGNQTTNWATGKVIQQSSSSENTPTISGHKQTKKPKKVIRMAGGQTWEDTSLLNWDTNDFRLFAGDLGNDVTDEVLTRTFSRYPSFQMAKVVRDKRSNKTKGYGFVSFKDPADFTKAIKEMDGKYVGSRPIKLRKSNWKDRNIDVVKQKTKMKQQMGYK